MKVQTPALMSLIQSAKTTATLLMSLSLADWLPTVKMFTSRLFGFQSRQISDTDRDSDAVQINRQAPYRPHTSSPTGLLICPPTYKLCTSSQRNSNISGESKSISIDLSDSDNYLKLSIPSAGSSFSGGWRWKRLELSDV